MISHDDVVVLKKELEPDYQARHDAMRRLRDLWHGRYWEQADNDAKSISSIFQDLRGQASEVGPDIKLVHNVLQQMCVKFQTYLAPTPMIRVYADENSKRGRANATKKERYLYGCWSENNMGQALGAFHGFFLPLMGSSFKGIFPDFERNIPRALHRSPEYAYPIPSADGGEDGVIFCWKTKRSRARRAWPSYDPDSGKGRVRMIVSKVRPGPSDPDVEIMEYADKNEFHRFVDAKRVNGVEHNFGFCLFEHLKFISVPGEQFGHGAVEQMVGLNEMTNALLSLLFQAVMENVFPELVLINPHKAPEEIERGPGAIIPINEGGGAQYLTPPMGALPVQQQFIQNAERMMGDAASMPEVNFGRFDASIVTGKAINELQGAGSGSTVEMVQGNGIGPSLVRWNEKAIFMAQTMFKDDRIELFGVKPSTGFDIAPPAFALTLKKGSELKGSQRNDVVFMPHMDAHSKLVMGLQGMGAGLFSKEHVRNQVGIPDSQAMDEEIASEAVNDAYLQSILQALMQGGADAGVAFETEEQALAFLQNRKIEAPAPAPQQQLPPGVPPELAAMFQPAGGAAGPPPGPATPGGDAGGGPLPAAPPDLGAPEAEGGEEIVTLDDVIPSFQEVSNVRGRVFLVGELVETGQTDDEIEVAITEGADRETLADSLPEFAPRMVFHSVDDEPDEQFIEVTPGSAPNQGGSEPILEEDDLEIEDGLLEEPVA